MQQHNIILAIYTVIAKNAHIGQRKISRYNNYYLSHIIMRIFTYVDD